MFSKSKKNIPKSKSAHSQLSKIIEGNENNNIIGITVESTPKWSKSSDPLGNLLHSLSCNQSLAELANSEENIQSNPNNNNNLNDNLNNGMEKEIREKDNKTNLNEKNNNNLNNLNCHSFSADNIIQTSTPTGFRKTSFDVPYSSSQFRGKRKLSKSKNSSKFDPMSTLSSDLENLLKNIKKAEKRLGRINKIEKETNERIKSLQVREKELLKSCSKLDESTEINFNYNNNQSINEKNEILSSENSNINLNNNSNNNLNNLNNLPKKIRKKTFSHFVKNSNEENILKISIDIKDIEINKQLGSGSSGAIVYKVTIDGWSCAMKELSRKLTNYFDEESFEREMSILYKLPKHPNIIRYLYHKKLKGFYFKLFYFIIILFYLFNFILIKFIYLLFY